MPKLIARVQQSALVETERMRLVELIEAIVVYTFPRRSRQEIAAMLGLTDLKETRFYQETREEALRDGHEAGLQEGRKVGLQEGRKVEAVAIILRQLTRKLDTPLSEDMQEQVKQLSLETLESLGEALFDFTTLVDLETWLAQNLPTS